MADKHVMETIIKLAGSIDPSLGKSANEASKALQGMNLKAVGMKVAFAGAAIVAVKAMADMAKGLYDLGSQFDSAYDAIRIGTGATGEALENLKDDFKDVYKSVPTTMEDAGKAIADYNTRLGLTGKELSELSKQAIAVSNMLGEDLNGTIEASSKTFQVWHVDSKNMEKEMDYMFKVSQSTGIGFSKLMQNLQQYGPQLQNLGYSFETSAAMIGQMEKAGLRTEEVMGALKKSVGVFADDGLDATKGLQVYYEKIKNAGDAAKATALANEVFGKRAGSTMANAIRSGALAVDAFTKSLNENDETIMKAMWDTADAPEKWQLLTQQFQTAIEPLAGAVFDSLGQIMPSIMQIFESITPVISQLSEVLAPVITYIAQFVSILISELSPVLLELAQTLFPSLMTVIKNLEPVIKILAEVISYSLINAIQVLSPIFNSLIAVIANLLEFITNVFTGQWRAAWTNIVEILKNLFKGLTDIVLAPFRAVGNGINKIKGKFNGGKGNSAEIPMLAAGGFTNGISIAGEAGREAVISFDPAYRSDNISTWLKAGELLGVATSSKSNSYNIEGITFSPNLYFTQKMSDSDVLDAIKRAGSEFGDMIEDRLEMLNHGSYKSASLSY